MAPKNSQKAKSEELAADAGVDIQPAAKARFLEAKLEERLQVGSLLQSHLGNLEPAIQNSHETAVLDLWVFSAFLHVTYVSLQGQCPQTSPVQQPVGDIHPLTMHSKFMSGSAKSNRAS